MYNKNAMFSLKKSLLSKYSKDIDRIILYGSRVENTEDYFSDYDLLLVLNHAYDWKLKRDIRNLTYDINLDYDIVTDTKFVSKDELNSLIGAVPFIQEALAKGVIL